MGTILQPPSSKLHGTQLTPVRVDLSPRVDIREWKLDSGVAGFHSADWNFKLQQTLHTKKGRVNLTQTGCFYPKIGYF